MGPCRHGRIKWIHAKASKIWQTRHAIIPGPAGNGPGLAILEGIISVKTGQPLGFKYLGRYDPDDAIPTRYEPSAKVKRGEQLYL